MSLNEEKLLDKVYEIAKRATKTKADFVAILNTLENYDMFEMISYKKNKKYVMVGGLSCIWIIETKYSLDNVTGFSNDPNELTFDFDTMEELSKFLEKNIHGIDKISLFGSSNMTFEVERPIG